MESYGDPAITIGGILLLGTLLVILLLLNYWNR